MDALEGLFGELLDITRIDTGGVEVNPAGAPARPVRPPAPALRSRSRFEKGLMLSFRGDRHVARRPRAAGTRAAQPGEQRHPLHRRRRRARELPRAAAAAAGAGVGLASASPKRCCRASSTSFSRSSQTGRWKRTSAKGLGLGWRS